MKKLISLLLVAGVILLNGFWLFEGGFAKADTATSSTSASLDYPVDLDVTAEIALTCDVSSSTLPSIAGIVGGSSTSDRSCNVSTNDGFGYIMTVKSGFTPALRNLTHPAHPIPDYAASVPETWTNPASTTSAFGFTVLSTGGTIDPAFSSIPSYRGFNTTTPITVASASDATAFAGQDTDIGYKVFVGSAANQATGHYSAAITVTANAQ